MRAMTSVLRRRDEAKSFLEYAEPHNPVALRVRLSSFIHNHAVVIAQVSMLFRIMKLKIPPPHGPQAIFPPSPNTLLGPVTYGWIV